MNLWEECNGSHYITKLNLSPWRIVEAQHISNTRKLVDSSEEHDILENLLEASKPLVTKNTDYLIFTPFRYPPLKYGSRFGSRLESSLWYGSLNIETAFAEVSYYRLLFLNDTKAKLDYISIFLTVFSTQIHTNAAINLTQDPFKPYQEKISSPQSYQYSQLLGSMMRNSKIEAFLYTSARDLKKGINFAAFTSSIFIKRNKGYISQQQTWSCIANKTVVEFIREGINGKEKYIYPISNFYIDGCLLRTPEWNGVSQTKQQAQNIFNF